MKVSVNFGSLLMVLVMLMAISTSALAADNVEGNAEYQLGFQIYDENGNLAQAGVLVDEEEEPGIRPLMTEFRASNITIQPGYTAYLYPMTSDGMYIIPIGSNTLVSGDVKFNIGVQKKWGWAYSTSNKAWSDFTKYYQMSHNNDSAMKIDFSQQSTRNPGSNYIAFYVENTGGQNVTLTSALFYWY